MFDREEVCSWSTSCCLCRLGHQETFDFIGLGYNVINVRNETELFVNEDTEIFCFVLLGNVLAEHGDVPYRVLTTFHIEECRAFIGFG